MKKQKSLAARQIQQKNALKNKQQLNINLGLAEKQDLNRKEALVKELSQPTNNTTIVNQNEKTITTAIKTEYQTRQQLSRPTTSTKQLQRPASSVLMRPQSSISHLQKTQASHQKRPVSGKSGRSVVFLKQKNHQLIDDNKTVKIEHVMLNMNTRYMGLAQKRLVRPQTSHVNVQNFNLNLYQDRAVTPSEARKSSAASSAQFKTSKEYYGTYGRRHKKHSTIKNGIATVTQESVDNYFIRNTSASAFLYGKTTQPSYIAQSYKSFTIKPRLNSNDQGSEGSQMQHEVKGSSIKIKDSSGLYGFTQKNPQQIIREQYKWYNMISKSMVTVSGASPGAEMRYNGDLVAIMPECSTAKQLGDTLKQPIERDIEPFIEVQASPSAERNSFQGDEDIREKRQDQLAFENNKIPIGDSQNLSYNDFINQDIDGINFILKANQKQQRPLSQFQKDIQSDMAKLQQASVVKMNQINGMRRYNDTHYQDFSIKPNQFQAYSKPKSPKKPIEEEDMSNHIKIVLKQSQQQRCIEKEEATHPQFQKQFESFINVDYLTRKQKLRIQSAKITKCNRNQIIRKNSADLNCNSLKITALQKYLGVQSVKQQTQVVTSHHTRTASFELRRQTLLEQQEEERRNDPEEKLRKLEIPKETEVKYEILMKQFETIFDKEKLEIATLFKINYIPNNVTNKINLDKYDYEAKGELIVSNNISSTEQLKHALKSRQDKVNFFRKDLVTIAQYCYCVYNDKRLMKPTYDILIEIDELMRNPVQQTDHDLNGQSTLQYIVPVHDLINIEDEEVSQILQIEFDLSSKKKDVVYHHRDAQVDNQFADNVIRTKNLKSTRRGSSISDLDLLGTGLIGESNINFQVNQDRSLINQAQTVEFKKQQIIKIQKIPFAEYVSKGLFSEAQYSDQEKLWAFISTILLPIIQTNFTNSPLKSGKFLVLEKNQKLRLLHIFDLDSEAQYSYNNQVKELLELIELKKEKELEIQNQIIIQPSIQHMVPEQTQTSEKDQIEENSKSSIKVDLNEEQTSEGKKYLRLPIKKSQQRYQITTKSGKNTREFNQNSLQEFLENQRGNYGFLNKDHIVVQRNLTIGKSRAISTSELPFGDPNSNVQKEGVQTLISHTKDNEYVIGQSNRDDNDQNMFNSHSQYKLTACPINLNKSNGGLGRSQSAKRGSLHKPYSSAQSPGQRHGTQSINNSSNRMPYNDYAEALDVKTNKYGSTSGDTSHRQFEMIPKLQLKNNLKTKNICYQQDVKIAGENIIISPYNSFGPDLQKESAVNEVELFSNIQAYDKNDKIKFASQKFTNISNKLGMRKSIASQTRNTGISSQKSELSWNQKNVLRTQVAQIDIKHNSKFSNLIVKEIQSYLVQFNLQYANMFKIESLYQKQLNNPRGKLLGTSKGSECGNLFCQVINYHDLDINYKSEDLLYNFLVKLELLENIYLYYIQNKLTMKTHKPPQNDVEFINFVRMLVKCFNQNVRYGNIKAPKIRLNKVKHIRTKFPVQNVQTPQFEKYLTKNIVFVDPTPFEQAIAILGNEEIRERSIAAHINTDLRKSQSSLAESTQLQEQTIRQRSSITISDAEVHKRVQQQMGIESHKSDRSDSSSKFIKGNEVILSDVIQEDGKDNIKSVQLISFEAKADDQQLCNQNFNLIDSQGYRMEPASDQPYMENIDVQNEQIDTEKVEQIVSTLKASQRHSQVIIPNKRITTIGHASGSFLRKSTDEIRNNMIQQIYNERHSNIKPKNCADISKNNENEQINSKSKIPKQYDHSLEYAHQFLGVTKQLHPQNHHQLSNSKSSEQWIPICPKCMLYLLSFVNMSDLQYL